jgi:hypothetical protein
MPVLLTPEPRGAAGPQAALQADAARTSLLRERYPEALPVLTGADAEALQALLRAAAQVRGAGFAAYALCCAGRGAPGTGKGLGSSV